MEWYQTRLELVLLPFQCWTQTWSGAGRTWAPGAGAHGNFWKGVECITQPIGGGWEWNQQMCSRFCFQFPKNSSPWLMQYDRCYNSYYLSPWDSPSKCGITFLIFSGQSSWNLVITSLGWGWLVPEHCDGGRCWATKRNFWLASYFSKLDQYSLLS